MNAIALDTHAFVKELTAAGFSEAQAEAVTSVVRRTREIDVSDLATRGDLAVLRSDFGSLRSELGALRTEIDLKATKTDVVALGAVLEAKVSKAESDIIKWVMGMIGFQAVAILGAVVALVRFLRP